MTNKENNKEVDRILSTLFVAMVEERVDLGEAEEGKVLKFLITKENLEVFKKIIEDADKYIKTVLDSIELSLTIGEMRNIDDLSVSIKECNYPKVQENIELIFPNFKQDIVEYINKNEDSIANIGGNVTSELELFENGGKLISPGDIERVTKNSTNEILGLLDRGSLDRIFIKNENEDKDEFIQFISMVADKIEIIKRLSKTDLPKPLKSLEKAIITRIISLSNEDLSDEQKEKLETIKTLLLK